MPKPRDLSRGGRKKLPAENRSDWQLRDEPMSKLRPPGLLRLRDSKWKDKKLPAAR